TRPPTGSSGTGSRGTTSPGIISPGTTSPGTTSRGTIWPGTTWPGITSPGTPANGRTSPGTTWRGTVSSWTEMALSRSGLCVIDELPEVVHGDESGSGEPAAPRRQSLLRSQARYALLPAAAPRVRAVGGWCVVRCSAVDCAVSDIDC